MSRAQPDETAVAEALALVAPAAAAFEARWTFSALARVDANLKRLLSEQVDLYNEAMITGSRRELMEHAQATVRGYGAAVRAMTAAAIEDDAYLIGHDGKTGTRVCIADSKHAAGRVQQVDGRPVIFITPDEVAKLVGGMQALADVKSLFPDAEVIDLYPAEPPNQAAA